MELKTRIAIGLVIALFGTALEWQRQEWQQKRAALSAPPPAPDYVLTEAAQQAQNLSQQGKNAEAVALLDKHLVDHPKDASAHVAVAAAHATLGFDMEPGTAQPNTSRQDHLEKSMEHNWRALALMKDVDAKYRQAPLYALVALYGPSGLNRPVDVERVARQIIDETPHEAHGYRALARVMRETGRTQEATAVLRDAQFQVGSDNQRELADAIEEHIKSSPRLPRADVEQLTGIILAIRKTDPPADAARRR